MIEYEKFSLAAPPCVYSHWLAYALTKAGLEARRNTPMTPPPLGYDRFVLGLIRHPLSWLHAYHTNIQGAPTGVPEVDVFRDCYRGSKNRFPLFIESYLRQCPGAVSRMFYAYRSSNVLRVEDCPTAAVLFLREMGINTEYVSRYVFSDPCGWMSDLDLRKSVVFAEEDFCLEYNYW